MKFITKRIRAQKALGYVKGSSILDIGCGDGHFLSRAKLGLDRINGQEINKTLNFPSNSFDTVSLLAVIEHLEHDKEIIKEIHRILKPNGRIIITTPLKKSEKLMKLYCKTPEDHKRYYDEDSLFKLLKGFRVIDYKKFELGMNQIIVGEAKK